MAEFSVWQRQVSEQRRYSVTDRFFFTVPVYREGYGTEASRYGYRPRGRQTNSRDTVQYHHVFPTHYNTDMVMKARQKKSNKTKRRCCSS